jgi:hypothetical protein
MPTPKKTPEQQWAKIIKGDPDECWPWGGGYFNTGYGRVIVKRKSRQAHRFAWEYANGRPVPEGMDILHSCDNKKCCNPNHLRPGTDIENKQDALNRMRNVAGEDNPSSKLTAAHVLAIRLIRRAYGVQLHIIGAAFGVSGTVASKIASGKAWKRTFADHSARIDAVLETP